MSNNVEPCFTGLTLLWLILTHILDMSEETSNEKHHSMTRSNCIFEKLLIVGL